MKPVEFEHVNAQMGEGQEEYQVLPALIIKKAPECPVISCWELSDEDIKVLIETRRIWVTQLRFGELVKDGQGNPTKDFKPHPLQPIHMTVNRDEAYVMEENSTE